MNSFIASPIPPFSSLPPASSGDSGADPRAGFRTKTVGTRLSVSELEEVEAAAKRGGTTLAEWLREVALREARPGPPNPVELVLAELAATRYLLLNLFLSTAEANTAGHALQPETVPKIREAADARKHDTARKMLEEFLAGGTKSKRDVKDTGVSR